MVSIIVARKLCSRVSTCSWDTLRGTLHSTDSFSVSVHKNGAYARSFFIQILQYFIRRLPRIQPRPVLPASLHPFPHPHQRGTAHSVTLPSSYDQDLRHSRHPLCALDTLTTSGFLTPSDCYSKNCSHFFVEYYLFPDNFCQKKLLFKDFNM